jgi:hypothetical protein
MKHLFFLYLYSFNGYIASRSVTIASDILEKIKIKYPDLNLEWLITGKGEMLWQPNAERDAKETQHDDGYKDRYLELLEKYTAVLEELERFKKNMRPTMEMLSRRRR